MSATRKTPPLWWTALAPALSACSTISFSPRAREKVHLTGPQSVAGRVLMITARSRSQARWPRPRSSPGSWSSSGVGPTAACLAGVDRTVQCYHAVGLESAEGPRFVGRCHARDVHAVAGGGTAQPSPAPIACHLFGSFRQSLSVAVTRPLTGRFRAKQSASAQPALRATPGLVGVVAQTDCTQIADLDTRSAAATKAQSERRNALDDV